MSLFTKINYLLQVVNSYIHSSSYLLYVCGVNILAPLNKERQHLQSTKNKGTGNQHPIDIINDKTAALSLNQITEDLNFMSLSKNDKKLNFVAYIIINHDEMTTGYMDLLLPFLLRPKTRQPSWHDGDPHPNKLRIPRINLHHGEGSNRPNRKVLYNFGWGEQLHNGSVCTRRQRYLSRGIKK